MTLLACCLAMVSVLGVPAELRRTLALSDVTQVGFHPAPTPPSGIPATGTSFDFSTLPAAVLTFQLRRSEFDVSYLPRFTWFDAFGSQRELLQLHTGTASYSYSERKWRFSIAQSGSIGTQNFSTLTFTAAPSPNAGATANPTTPQVNPIPQSSTISILSEQTSGSFSYNWTRRWISSVYAAYGISGGRGSDQDQLPRTNTTTAGAILTYAMTRRDQFATNVSYVISDTSNGFNHQLFQASEMWSHSFSRRLSGTLMAGIIHERSTQTTTNPEGTVTTETSPMASAGITGTIMRRNKTEVMLTLGSTFGLVLNPFTGDIQKRLQWLSILSARHYKTTVMVTLDGAQTFPADENGAFSLVGLGGVVSQEVSKLISLSAGIRYIWQNTHFTEPQTVSTLPDQWYAFAGISIHPPPIRL